MKHKRKALDFVITESAGSTLPALFKEKKLCSKFQNFPAAAVINLQFKQRQDAKAEELEQAHKTFHRMMQHHEKLKQKYEEQKRKIVHNR